MARRALRKLHRTLGLSIGVWAALTALTGTLLVFGPEIDEWLNPNLLRVEPRASRQPVDSSWAQTRARFPGQSLHSLRMPQSADEPLILRVGPLRRNVFVDPYTGAVLGSRGEHEGAVGTLHALHVELLVGEPGKIVVGILGVVFVLMTIAGMALAWRSTPRRARAVLGRPAGGATRWASVHRSVGVVAGPLLVVVAATGSMLVFHQPTTAALVATLGGPPAPALPTVPVAPARRALPLQSLIDSADAALPGAHPTYVLLPAAPAAPLVVRQRFSTNSHPNGRSWVAVDFHTGAVLQVHDWRTAGRGVRTSDFKYPLHTGMAFGPPGRAVTAVLGLLPMLLLVSAGVGWWRRSRGRALRLRAAAAQAALAGDGA